MADLSINARRDLFGEVCLPIRPQDPGLIREPLMARAVYSTWHRSMSKSSRGVKFEPLIGRHKFSSQVGAGSQFRERSGFCSSGAFVPATFVEYIRATHVECQRDKREPENPRVCFAGRAKVSDKPAGVSHNPVMNFEIARPLSPFLFPHFSVMFSVSLARWLLCFFFFIYMFSQTHLFLFLFCWLRLIKSLVDKKRSDFSFQFTS